MPGQLATALPDHALSQLPVTNAVAGRSGTQRSSLIQMAVADWLDRRKKGGPMMVKPYLAPETDGHIRGSA
jgi:hypothetical protein